MLLAIPFYYLFISAFFPPISSMTLSEFITTRDANNKHIEHETPAESSIMSIISSIITGNFDLTTVNLPASYLKPESSLDTWSKRNVNTFATIASKTNPIDRMLAVAQSELENLAFFKHKFRKPFNPILGEVFTATYGPDNSVRVVSGFIN